MNLESKIKLKESVEDWADFKLRDCMPTDEDFKFVIECIEQYRDNKEEAPLYCSPRGFALCVRGSTILKIKFLNWNNQLFSFKSSYKLLFSLK